MVHNAGDFWNRFMSNNWIIPPEVWFPEAVWVLVKFTWSHTVPEQVVSYAAKATWKTIRYSSVSYSNWSFWILVGRRPPLPVPSQWSLSLLSPCSPPCLSPYGASRVLRWRGWWWRRTSTRSVSSSCRRPYAGPRPSGTRATSATAPSPRSIGWPPSHSPLKIGKLVSRNILVFSITCFAK